MSDLAWSRFGRDIGNYVEPFFGSGAVLLGRGQIGNIETVNDLDGFVANFWRATSKDPDSVAHWCDWPVNEADLSARHLWLVNHGTDMTAKVQADPNYHDPKIAGWWVWGLCFWIGSGWCSGEGPWIANENGHLSKLGNAGRGIKRQRPHLGNAGRGINRQRPHLGDAGRGINQDNQEDRTEYLISIFRELRDRLRNVRVCCGDWSRVLGPSPTFNNGTTAVFLDPPYADTADRHANIYREDCLSVAHDVRRWAVKNGNNPELRIALCGYEGEHEIPESWECVPWKANGGYGSQGTGSGRDNSARERIWFSPACLKPDDEKQGSLFSNFPDAAKKGAR